MKTQTPFDRAAFAEGARRFHVENVIAVPDPLDTPPASFGQVLCWLDQLIEHGEPYPNQQRFRAAQALPPKTALRDVLICLGADPARTPNCEMTTEEP